MEVQIFVRTPVSNGFLLMALLKIFVLVFEKLWVSKWYKAADMLKG